MLVVRGCIFVVDTHREESQSQPDDQMGKLRLSTFLPGHGKAPSAINPSFVADRTLVGIRENLAEHVERIDTRLDSEQPPQAKAETASPESWPILTRRKPEKDLPFIPSTDVRKRDGREDSRLCTYLCTSADTASVC